MFIIFWDFLIVEQIFLAPQVKGSMINSNKHGIYDFPYELRNSLWLRILELRKFQENLKTSYNYFLAISPFPEIKILSALVKISWKTKIELSRNVLVYMKATVCLKYFVKTINYFVKIIKTLFTLGLEHKIYKNGMIAAKDKKVIHASARGPHASRADYGKLPTQKTQTPRTENVENSLIFYYGFKTVLTDQVRAKNR